MTVSVSDVGPGSQIGERALGDLTPAGISTIEELSAELWQALVAEQVDLEQAECFLADSPAVVLWLPDYDVVLIYGVECPPPEVLALDQLYRELISDLADCRANEWVTPREGCTPVELLQS